MKFSILIPAYNGEGVIGDTLRSILSQSYENYEIIINDDCSDDNTVRISTSLMDQRIKVTSNARNLGYSRNLEECRKKASGEIIFLMGQDDILANDALLKTYNAFAFSRDVGAVTRPFYSFDNDISVAVRAWTKEFNPQEDELVSIHDDPDRVIGAIHTLGQLSGLAFRKEYMDLPFHEDVFPCHIYPFISVMKKYPIVFLSNYTVAVRIMSSQSRKVSSIYEKSPLRSWVEMFQEVLAGPEYEKVRRACITEYAATNYVGLVQIRNFAKYRYLLREIALLVKYRPLNIVNPYFWFFSIGTLVMSPRILLPLVDWYKRHVNSALIKNIEFHFTLKDAADGRSEKCSL